MRAPTLLTTGLVLLGSYLTEVSTFSLVRRDDRARLHCRQGQASPLHVSSSSLSPDVIKAQEQTLIKRGLLEEKLMAKNQSPILAPVVDLDGRSRFDTREGEARWLADILRRDGVIRIDNVLPKNIADTMRAYVLNLRARSEKAVQTGQVSRQERFADVLLNTNRCDLKIPLGPYQVHETLASILCSSSNSLVYPIMEHLLGPNATLYELSSLISHPGSQRQNVHPDNPCLSSQDNGALLVCEEEALLLTCFIALQDIDLAMGPTVWLPGTHRAAKHALYQSRRVECMLDSPESPKDRLLRTTPSVVGIVPTGSCVIFDSRLLHCGGSNKSEETRVLFYFSFKNPKVDYPGNRGSIGYGLGAACIQLGKLRGELRNGQTANSDLLKRLWQSP